METGDVTLAMKWKQRDRRNSSYYFADHIKHLLNEVVCFCRWQHWFGPL